MADQRETPGSQKSNPEAYNERFEKGAKPIAHGAVKYCDGKERPGATDLSEMKSCFPNSNVGTGDGWNVDGGSDKPSKVQEESATDSEEDTDTLRDGPGGDGNATEEVILEIKTPLLEILEYQSALIGDPDLNLPFNETIWNDHRPDSLRSRQSSTEISDAQRRLARKSSRSSVTGNSNGKCGNDNAVSKTFHEIGFGLPHRVYRNCNSLVTKFQGEGGLSCVEFWLLPNHVHFMRTEVLKPYTGTEEKSSFKKLLDKLLFISERNANEKGECLGPLKSPKGILFHGSSRDTKIALAEAVSIDLEAVLKQKVHFVDTTGTSIASECLGETIRNIENVFQEASEMKPSVVFIDKLDHLFLSKGQSGRREVNAIISKTLVSYFDKLPAEVLVIGETGKLEAIDHALKRPGRFDKNLEFHWSCYLNHRVVLVIVCLAILLVLGIQNKLEHSRRNNYFEDGHQEPAFYLRFHVGNESNCLPKQFMLYKT